MPNWCTITVIIEGEREEDLSQFATTVGDDFDFERIIPMPEELYSTTADGHHEHRIYYGESTDQDELERCRAELDQDPKNRAKADQDKALLEKYGAYDWYDWCLMNWGTKWSPSNVNIESNEDRITMIFDTAWSFPEPIFQKLSEMFPSLYFRGQAVEPGIGWALVFEAHDGRVRIARLDYDQEYASQENEENEGENS
jgi:Ferredoxin-like domain in Api92-like protein